MTAAVFVWLKLLAAVAALRRPLVLGHVIVEPGERTKTPAAVGAVVVGFVSFVVISEHGSGLYSPADDLKDRNDDVLSTAEKATDNPVAFTAFGGTIELGPTVFADVVHRAVL